MDKRTIEEEIAKDMLVDLDTLFGSEHQARVTELMGTSPLRIDEERELNELLKKEEGAIALAKAGFKPGDEVTIAISPANTYDATIKAGYSRVSATLIRTNGQSDLAPLNWITHRK